MSILFSNQILLFHEVIKIYYSNITNSEIQYFHGLTAPNFTITLTQLLESDLFKIETLKENTYKIYPLFYTETIDTNNPEDTVIDDQVILCHRNPEKETYLTFTSDPDEDVQEYQSFVEYYGVGDSLTLNEYNGIVSLLRNSMMHSDTVNMLSDTVGDYGNYRFSVDGCTVLDTGLVVNDETRAAEPKVMLTDNVFHYSTYTLKLEVLHFTGVNVLDDDSGDYRVVDTLELELVKDTWVPFPLDDLEDNYIISLDAVVDITHDKPEIHMITGLTVSGEPDIIQSGESAEIYTQLVDYEGYPYNINDASGKTVYFFERLTPTFTLTATPNPIQTGDTSDIYASVKDSDGSKIRAGTPVYFYQVEGAEPPLPTPTITLTGSNINVGETLTLTGVLSAGEDESVKIYQGETLLDTVTTGVDGAFSKTVTGLTSGSYTFKAVFDGNEEYQGATSSNLSITVSKLTSTISLTGSDITVGETLELTGVLSVGSGSSVKIYQDNVIIDTVTTGTGGAFSENVTGLSVGQYSFKAVFEGDSTYTGVTSSIVQVTVSDVPTVLTVSADKDILSYADNEKSVITATLTGGVVSGKSVVFKKGDTVLATETTDSNGEATYEYTSQGVGDVTLTVECMSLQETYTIEDCIDYDPLSTNKSKFSGTGINPVYSDTGLCVNGNANSDSYYAYQSTLPSTFSIEFEFKSINFLTTATGKYSSEVYVHGIELGEHETNGIFYGNGGTLTYTHNSFNAGDILRFDYDGSYVSVYRNDSLIVKLSKTSSSIVGFKTHNTRNICVKNLKVKPL